MNYLIWPKPIPVIGLTGEYASGKTLFGLTIDPANTLVFDEEKSSATYDDLGVKKRIDLLDEVRKLHPNGFQPIHVYQYFHDQISAIKPGEFSVIMVDTVGLIESGLADWVAMNPQFFGKTAAQYKSAQALFWGDVKEYWKVILADIATRCQTFVFTVHMGAEFKGGAPTGKRKPKGKETLMELASLFLQMERKVDPTTKEMQSTPSATVLKHRLVKSKIVDGEIVMLPLVPPRLPKATPTAIRKYLLTPPDYSKLTADEQAREEKLSEDDKLQLEVARVKALQGMEEAKLETTRLEKMVTASSNSSSQPTRPATAPEAKPHTPGKTNPDQLRRVKELQSDLFVSRNLNPNTNKEECIAAWKEVLKPFAVDSAAHLTESQVVELISQLEKIHDPFTAGPSPTPSAS